MKKHNGYEIDFVNEQIVVSKAFLKAAGTLGTPEYKEMITLRSENPGFPFVQREITKREGKKSYRNLTYANMREYIVTREGEKSDTITVSARFLRQSHVYDSDEFTALLRLTKELRGFEIRVRCAPRLAHRLYMPTYDEMIARIRITSDNATNALEEFEAIRECARVSRRGYMMVISWFVDTYGCHSESGCRAA